MVPGEAAAAQVLAAALAQPAFPAPAAAPSPPVVAAPTVPPAQVVVILLSALRVINPEPESIELPYEMLLLGRKELPNVSPNNPRFNAAIELWKRVPMPLARAIGPFLIRLVP